MRSMLDMLISGTGLLAFLAVARILF